MNSLKYFIKKSINALGLEVHRFNAKASSLGLFMTTLEKFKIDVVLDIGANQGQYAQLLRRAGFQGEIISFEPISYEHKILEKNCKGDSKWSAHPRCAIGEFDGEVELNLSQNSVSSSVLPMLASHVSAAPMSTYVGREMVSIHKLDSIWPTINFKNKSSLLKIDTQGYEWQVLNGAQEMLKDITAIQIELSLLPLYEGQYLWRDFVDRLENEGFSLWSLQPAFTDHATGRTMQWDGLFLRQ